MTKEEDRRIQEKLNKQFSWGEEFNEWKKTLPKELKESMLFTHRYIAKKAWEFQQTKIDQLEKDKQELIKLLISFFTVDNELDGMAFEEDTKQSLAFMTGKSIEELLK